MRGSLTRAALLAGGLLTLAGCQACQRCSSAPAPCDSCGTAHPLPPRFTPRPAAPTPFAPGPPPGVDRSPLPAARPPVEPFAPAPVPERPPFDTRPPGAELGAPVAPGGSAPAGSPPPGFVPPGARLGPPESLNPDR